jgi:hypothetical protein
MKRKKAHRIKGKRIKMPMWKEREGNIKRRGNENRRGK